jgi:transcriptional regulator with XRE-family HTH domain
MQLRITQEELADSLDLSFQQVQKYEKGKNRIAAGRLERIAEFLKVPVSFFFGPVVGVQRENLAVMDFMNTAHSLRLLQAYSRIQDKKLQRTLLELIEQVAGATKG